MTAAQTERRALVDTFRAVGPDAPTLCGAWTTRDLAAHLVIRERRLDAAPGILLPALAGHTERVQDRFARSKSWDDLVDLVAGGPPLFSPFKALDSVANVSEMFIHHEDVRRCGADWQPRPVDDSVRSALRRPLSLMSRLTLAKAPVRVLLRTPAGEQLAAVGRGRTVTMTGEPQELLLFVSGRDVADVQFDADPDTVAAVRAARRGL